MTLPPLAGVWTLWLESAERSTLGQLRYRDGELNGDSFKRQALFFHVDEQICGYHDLVTPTLLNIILFFLF
jgi:hypothetical protein